MPAETDSWWREGALYQIYPRSYQDTNRDGIGDLAGITERLDHLQWLGIRGVWLSPVTVSPNADFGYDVADFCDVDPSLGKMSDLETLITEAAARDIKILLDLVPNHTSIDHPWFQESRSSRDNPKRDWYWWREQPNDWRSFLNQRLTSLSATPPMGGIEQSGWHLVYNDKPNTALQYQEGRAKGADLNATLGFNIRENGSIGDVVPESIAARAGLTPGAHIVAVNGRAYSTARLRDALKASSKTTTPMTLIVQNGEFFTTASIDYHGGEKYPHLERTTGKPDWMETLIKPLAPPPAPPKKK